MDVFNIFFFKKDVIFKEFFLVNCIVYIDKMNTEIGILDLYFKIIDLIRSLLK